MREIQKPAKLLHWKKFEWSTSKMDFPSADFVKYPFYCPANTKISFSWLKLSSVKVWKGRVQHIVIKYRASYVTRSIPHSFWILLLSSACCGIVGWNSLVVGAGVIFSRCISISTGSGNLYAIRFWRFISYRFNFTDFVSDMISYVTVLSEHYTLSISFFLGNLNFKLIRSRKWWS